MFEVLLVVLTLVGLTLIVIILKKDFTFKPPDVKIKSSIEGEFTTLLPLPLGAISCSHEWDEMVNQRLEMPHEQKVIYVAKCDKCGVLDKTIEVTSTVPSPILPPPSKLECRHKWKDERAITLDSAYEQMHGLLKTAMTSSRWNNKEKQREVVDVNLPDPNSAPAWMFQKSYLKSRVCSLCGEIHTVQAVNFEIKEKE